MDVLIGLLMSVLGNDLYDRCPRIAKWIVLQAVGPLLLLGSATIAGISLGAFWPHGAWGDDVTSSTVVSPSMPVIKGTFRTNGAAAGFSADFEIMWAKGASQ